MQVLRDDHIEMDGVYVAAESEGVTLTGREPGAPQIRLDSNQVAKLLGFLRSVVISPTDRRGAYRVRVPVAAGFRATTFTEQGSVSCEARDLSLTGARLQPSLPDAAGLELGALARVLLEFDNQSVISDATVVRRTGGELGVSFKNGSEDGVDPLPGLARMMRQLERYWIAEGWKA